MTKVWPQTLCHCVNPVNPIEPVSCFRPLPTIFILQLCGSKIAHHPNHPSFIIGKGVELTIFTQIDA